MQDIILLKQGEIVLKGLNKKYFEQKLLSNVKRRLHSLGEFDVSCTQSTIYIEPKSDAADMDAAEEAMTKVFGIAAVVRAAACEKTPEAMAEKAIEYMADAMREAKSFKVETRRADKAFPMTSIQVSQYVGGELAEAFPDTAVDVHDPELTVHVEVRERAAYIHRPPTPGAGGLPVGCGGTAVTLLSGGIDSPVSTYMIAKRGVHMIPCISSRSRIRASLPSRRSSISPRSLPPTADGSRSRSCRSRAFRPRSATNAPRNTSRSSCAGL